MAHLGPLPSLSAILIPLWASLPLLAPASEAQLGSGPTPFLECPGVCCARPSSVCFSHYHLSFPFGAVYFLTYAYSTVRFHTAWICGSMHTSVAPEMHTHSLAGRDVWTNIYLTNQNPHSAPCKFPRVADSINVSWGQSFQNPYIG